MHTELIAPAPKVLVLEEDGALREAIRMLLRAVGYCVLTAASLTTALSLAQHERGIEVVLMQERPPESVSGSQAIASLREVIGAQLKALLVTDRVSPSLRALEQDGGVRFARSPVGADELVAKLQSLRESSASEHRG